MCPHLAGPLCSLAPAHPQGGESGLGSALLSARNRTLSGGWHASSAAHHFVRKVAAAVEFLNRTNPLRHVAPVRKSQVQHAICDALAAILRPNALSDTPRHPLPLPSHPFLGPLRGVSMVGRVVGWLTPQRRRDATRLLPSSRQDRWVGRVCLRLSGVLHHGGEARTWHARRRLAGQLDAKALAAFQAAAAQLRAEIAAWTGRASKHAGPGYALVTMLLCLEDAATFGGYVDALEDHLHRQLKARGCSKPWATHTARLW